jgi:hypothetical protein
VRILQRHAKEEADAVVTTVADECEALLSGQLAEHHRSRGHAPVWTWLNAIAHGDEQVVRDIATRPGDDVETTTTAALARAVLADGRQVDVLQREVLVPLELRIAGDVITPRRLVELVGQAVFASVDEGVR